MRGVSLLGGTNIVVQGNYIGLTASGSTALGNGTNGVETGLNGQQLLTNSTIGGVSLAAANVISGNTGNGVLLNSASGAAIQGNFIGTDSTGMNAVPNGGDGIQVGVGDSSLTIAGNFIAGNAGNGINLLSSPALIQNNFIGTNATGSAALANGANGILVKSSTNTIGGGPGAGNLISGNTLAGIAILGTKNQVLGNQIGTNALGTAAVPNAIGISVAGSAATPSAAPAALPATSLPATMETASVSPRRTTRQHGTSSASPNRALFLRTGPTAFTSRAATTRSLGRSLSSAGTRWPASSWTTP